MGLWTAIVTQTASSRWKLAAFGTITCGALYVVGEMFSHATASGFDDKQRKARLAELPYDQRRMATAQQQRLSAMIKDTADGKTDHWSAAMRGTLIPHPFEENKTQGVDNQRMTRISGR